MNRFDIAETARFWSRVSIPDAPHYKNQCWTWTGSTAKGYGQVKIAGQVLRCHRVAYEMACGPLREDEHVLHSCDTPLCVNPSHLRTGTHDDNMRDMQVRGRAWRGGPTRKPNVFG